MNRRTAIRRLATLIFISSSIAQAQQAGKIFRIGFLDGGSAAGLAGHLKAFLDELSKLGWIEGKNIAFEYRFNDNKGPERRSELAAELVRLKVDLIVTTGTAAALDAKKATGTIPILMVNAANPVGDGLVAGLARPGGNVTGFSSLESELITKRLEILKDAVPKLDRVGLLRPPVANITQMKELRLAAVALRLKLEDIPTQINAKSLESAFKTAKQKQVGAIMTGTTGSILAERKRIVEFAAKYRLPAIYHSKEFVDDGGLMSYGVDYDDLYRKTAHYVDKILKGAKPADLPVQQATKFEFIISLKAAKQIGITLPYELLARANQVIK